MTVVLLVVSAGAMSACAKREAADLVLKNGVVYTVDEGGSTAQAVAIRDQMVVFVGSDSQATRFVGEGTNVIDLQGRMVLPGFIDSHLHPGSGAGRIFDLQLRGLDPKKEAYQAAVKAFADERPSAMVINGRGWSEAVFAGIGPRKEWLDEVVGDRPVILRSDGGHSTWVNSRALELAGVTRETPDPPGGVIEHDPATGEPSGTLREAASGLVAKLDPEDFTVEQYVQGYRWMQENVTGPLGITGAFSAGGSVGSNSYAAVERLAQSGDMTFWLRGAYTARPARDMDEWLQRADTGRRAHTTRHFQITAIKFYEDGVIEGHTALLLEPYADAEGYSGDPSFLGLKLWEPDALNAAVAAANKLKFQTHHHPIADRSVSVALDAIAHARRVNGESYSDSRDGMTHLTLVDPPDFQRFADLGVIAVPQPQWFLKDDYYFDVFVPFLGPERADRSYPMKSFFDAGAVVASSSDWGVTVPPNPLYGIQTAVMRTFPIPPFGGRVSSEVLWPEERITLDQAIRSYTINGAYSNFLEETRGSIESGKYADLIVLDRNLVEVEPSEVGKTTVLLTLYEGEEVFRHPSF
jgi:predicted amidohydrolase YtcJ